MRRVGVGLLVLVPSVAFAQGQPTPLIPPSINYQQGPQDQAQPAPQDQSQLAPQDQPPAPIEASPLAPPPGVQAAPEGAPPAQTQGPAPGRDQATAAPPAVPDQPALASQWPNKWVSQTGAVVQVLNKVDAISRDVTVKVGQTADIGSLSIKVQACVARPPDQPADAAAFLVIADGHKDEAGFQGWSLADEPWVSMLQNPVYNVRVVGCS